MILGLAMAATASDLLIDDFSSPDGISALDTRWSATSDRVMGGVSDVKATRRRGDKPHLHLEGVVREVPGAGSAGFVQVALDLGRLDASAFTGLRLVVKGNGRNYGAHLRTPDVRRPWQSWRGSFEAPETWTEVRIPFADFAAYRIDGELDLTRLRRLSILAVDEEGEADLKVAEVGLYK